MLHNRNGAQYVSGGINLCARGLESFAKPKPRPNLTTRAHVSLLDLLRHQDVTFSAEPPCGSRILATSNHCRYFARPETGTEAGRRPKRGLGILHQNAGRSCRVAPHHFWLAPHLTTRRHRRMSSRSNTQDPGRFHVTVHPQ
jgi:hypothetical protein